MGQGMQATRTLRIASAYQRVAWLLGWAAAAYAWPEGQEGIFFGGLIMALNGTAMRWSLQRLLQPKARPYAAVALLGSKFVLLLGLTIGVLLWAKPDPVGFMLGMSTLFAGMLGAAIHYSGAPQNPSPTNSNASI